jgi:[ribosomal protein S18]-alanine N-acetyltransferase
MSDNKARALVIRPLRAGEESRRCARMMAASEPWITLKRGYAKSLAIVEGRQREVHVALEDGQLRGFLILNMSGAFAGYIQTVCVAPEARRRRIGTQLVRFAEARIFRESPNVFLCVSSFNPRARALYRRLGYVRVGDLKDYLVPGHSETIFRKTIGSLDEFKQRRKRPAAPSKTRPGKRRARRGTSSARVILSD